LPEGEENLKQLAHKLLEVSFKIPVLRIRIGFSADPNLAFYLGADPDPEAKLIRI
jgi:hypothetical protein